TTVAGVGTPVTRVVRAVARAASGAAFGVDAAPTAARAPAALFAPSATTGGGCAASARCGPAAARRAPRVAGGRRHGAITAACGGPGEHNKGAEYFFHS